MLKGLLRSFLFLPAHNERFIEKVLVCDADGIILDLEDAVPPQNRETARNNIKKYFSDKNCSKKVFVRINVLGSIDFVRDMVELTSLRGIDGFMPSKIRDEKDMVFIDRLLAFFELKNGVDNGYYCLAPLIELTKAIENVSLIAGSSKRIVALCLGGEDYLNDLGCMYTYQHSALAFARASVVNAARAHGILPIDTPYLDINNSEDFSNCCRESFINGFAGSLLINPRQIEIANKVYMPDEEAIDYSLKVRKAINKAKEDGVSGVAMLDGAMVGPPMAKRADNILSLVNCQND